jgi:hypothetical protein
MNQRQAQPAVSVVLQDLDGHSRFMSLVRSRKRLLTMERALGAGAQPA